ncbi:MAG TPA: gas vesicle protein GvpG [Gemmatimonadaceae bacterium]|nr:gas vesicle protein GvpG [Gemmatimonadaceae bacterium]
MGLLTNILLAPFLGPVWGTRFTLDKVDRAVREQLTDDTPIKEDLMALQMKLEMGEIDDAEYAKQEAEIMQRLREVREWRERFGMSVGGGPVRVAEGDETE